MTLLVQAPFAVWNEWLECVIDALGGWNTVEGSWVRPGNNELTKRNIGGRKLKASQYRAQYGRANPILVETVINRARIGSHDKFIDIGSGIGHVAMQVACTVGCDAVGMLAVSCFVYLFGISVVCI